MFRYFPLGCLSLMVACTPVPERAQIRPTPRPIAPLPVETRAPKASPSGLTPQVKVAQPAKGTAKAPVLSATAVKARLQQAEDKAVSATNLAQSAQIKEDWALVISQWQQALKILSPITANSPQLKIVQQRRAEYQRNLAAAQRSATTLPQPLPQSASPRDRVPLMILPAASPSPTTSSSPSSPNSASPPPDRSTAPDRPAPTPAASPTPPS